MFDKQDWKNYTITVHGMKSSMRSIGATELSELAKQLEFAGKEGHIDYIRQHHEIMIKEYERLFAALRRVPLLCPEEVKEEEEELQQDLQPLSSEEFEQAIIRMEDAMFALNGAKMMEVAEELQVCSYFGKRLKDYLAPVKRKIQMSDFVSAVDALTRLRDELTDKEETL